MAEPTLTSGNAQRVLILPLVSIFFSRHCSLKLNSQVESKKDFYVLFFRH